MIKQFSLFFLVFSILLYGGEEDLLLRRIQSHLIIKDYHSAYTESIWAINRFPSTAALYESQIKSLALLGHEREMLKVWDQYTVLFPDKKNNRLLIEEMASGVLKKASHSPSLLIRLMGILAGFLSQDARGVAILKRGLNDSNLSIRALAVELASQLPDSQLIEEITRLFYSERAWFVRLQVIKAIGKMKIYELGPKLEAIIASESSLAEEKEAAVKSLIHLLDEIKREKIVELSQSNRFGLRYLACKAAAHFRSLRDVDLLLGLAQDNHPTVRTAAFQALGLIRPKGEEGDLLVQLAENRLNDRDLKVSISAAWLLTLYNSEKGKQALENFLNHNKDDIQILSSSALSSTGRYGVDLTKKYLIAHKNPYVKLNLALGIIGHKEEINRSAEMIYKVFNAENDNWFQFEEGIFSGIAPINIKGFSNKSSEQPEIENQMIRLEVLNHLAIIDPIRGQEAARQYLSDRNWGITGTAAILLLSEGNDEAIEMVKSLLSDKNDKVRVQSALVLSLWTREEEAIKVLENNYAKADKDLKIRILEGIGRIGAISSIPFLLNVLKEPSQQLRLVGAMALIQCLNH